MKVQNTHTLKFGAFIEQANKRQQSNSDVNIVVWAVGPDKRNRNNFGDVFVGKPIEFAQGTDRPIDNFRYYNYEFYAQDSWKMRPNFTIEAWNSLRLPAAELRTKRIRRVVRSFELTCGVRSIS